MGISNSYSNPSGLNQNESRILLNASDASDETDRKKWNHCLFHDVALILEQGFHFHIASSTPVFDCE